MRILSYNIHKGIGGRDRRYRLERVVAVIEHENPDLICLQEVDRHVPRSKLDDQPRLLTEHFRSVASTYQLNFAVKRGGYGNLILSRWEFQSQHHLSLRYQRRKPRGAQLVVIATPEGPLWLVNCHLGLAERERHWQVEHLLGHHLFAEADALPTLLIGDFNDWRNTLFRTGLMRHRFQQVTSPPSRFRSFPAYLPMGSLDKSFVRGVAVTEARVVRNAAAREASDHLPLVIDFHLQPDRFADRGPGS
ncbi:MAG TPA: endonuclease/exonuclease/phosphatase family protein [Pirellulales bacterium]|jgi:endonuclease/exonuclease/phosphatase family metal-dependent hydrolase|nr:endonuclease/exonuclease/phosphatase family protein [Pirellulales bacterium]